jgi:hypothetical protein
VNPPGAGFAGALVLGLVAVAVVVLSSRHLTPHGLGNEVAGQNGLYPVATSPSGWTAPADIDPFSLVADRRSWWMTIGLAVAYLGSVTALGSGIVRAVRSDDRWPRPVSILAGFLPGYLMLLAPLQLLFAAVPLGTAAWIAIVSPPIAALILHRRAILASTREVSTGRQGRRGAGWTVLSVAALVVLALVHRLQVDGAYLTQDSIQAFLQAGGNQLQGGAGSYLAQWDQQSDEWLFNAPLMFSSHHLGDLWFPFYVTQGLGVASFGALAFGIAHRLARRRKALAGGVVLLVLFAMTSAIYPWLYVTVIVGGQPLAAMGHVGRFVGIIAPWIAVLVVGRPPRSVSFALGLAALGLGFVSVNALIFVLGSGAAMIVWRVGCRHDVEWLGVGAFRAATHVLPAAALGAFVCAFWWVQSGSAPDAGGWLLLLGIAAALAGAVVVMFATPGRSASAAPRWLSVSVSLAAMATGLLLSNNLTEGLLHGWVRQALAPVLPGYDGLLLTRTGVGEGMFDSVSFPDLSEQACQIFIACRGTAGFLAVLGIVLVIALVTWIAMGPLTSEPTTNGRRYALLLLIAGLGVGLIATFFSGGSPDNAVNHQADIFSRVLEIPYYSLLGLAAVTFVESRSRVTAISGAGVLIFWSVIPFVAARRPEELVRNAGWLLQHTGII